MRQLDQQDYIAIESALEHAQVLTVHPGVLGIYEHAKEVYESGCKARGTQEICNSCAGLAVTMCVTINTAKQTSVAVMPFIN